MFDGYFVYILEIAKESIENSSNNKKLIERKLSLFDKILLLCNQYISSFAYSKIANDLVEVILSKKVEFIIDAKTIKELTEIEKSISEPSYNYSKFVPDSKYHIEQEEILFFSKVSLEAPLNEPAFKRYMFLFEKYIGKLDDLAPHL